MIKVKFGTGENIEVEALTTVYDAAAAAGLISRSVIACRIGDKVCDLTTPIAEDAEITLLTFEGALKENGTDTSDDGGRRTFWHTASHILAQAVKRLYPETKLTIGPSIENGFYYDFDSDISFTPELLSGIEAEMKKIVKENLRLERISVSRSEAKELMAEKGEDYKLLLIDRVPEGEDITLYRQGEFTDLCAGPHLFATGAVKAFKLTQCTGAYWEGKSENKMLQRVYGVAFPNKEMLNAHLEAVEEAKKRDHNKLGRELELFTTVDCIGQGLPIILPKGARIIQRLQRWVEDTEEKAGYLLTKTPLMAKRELYKISGHWDHYLDGMFVMGDPNDETKECFALRPMTCPFQYQVYLNRKRSYRELPMRLGETSTLFRNEDSGEMHGLIRVRQFTISEGHLVLRPDQLEEEFLGCVNLMKHFLGTLGLLEDCTFRFSQWDPNNRAKYEGTPEQWDEAQATMKKILDDIGLDYKIGIDEAAFYGPKLDVQCKNVFGKEDTIVTIQIDMLLAEKFGMYYTDSDNTQKIPYIIHRTSLGCYERTLALLIEKYAGAFPVWLSPTQATVLPISPTFADYAEKVTEMLKAAGVRAELDARNEKIGYRIREAQLSKVPYMIVVGANEEEAGNISVRARGEGDLGTMEIGAFADRVAEEVRTYKL